MFVVVVVHTPVTPFGNPVANAPRAPVVLYFISVNEVLIHIVCASVPADEVLVIVLLGDTTTIPVLVTVPHPPVKLMV